jgi:hypothetical protein
MAFEIYWYFFMAFEIFAVLNITALSRIKHSLHSSETEWVPQFTTARFETTI